MDNEKLLGQETRAYAVFKDDAFMCIVPHVGKYIEYVQSKNPNAKYEPRVSLEDIKKNSIFKIGGYIIEEVSDDIMKFSYVLKVLRKTYSEKSSYIPFAGGKMKPEIVVISTWSLHPVSKEGEKSMTVMGKVIGEDDKSEVTLTKLIENEITDLQKSNDDSSVEDNVEFEAIVVSAASGASVISDEHKEDVNETADLTVSMDSTDTDSESESTTTADTESTIDYPPHSNNERVESPDPRSGFFDVPRVLVFGPRKTGKTNIVFNRIAELIDEGRLLEQNIIVLTSTDSQHYIERFPNATIHRGFSINIFNKIISQWTDGVFRLLVIDDYGRMDYRGIPRAVLIKGVAHNMGFIHVEQSYPERPGLESVVYFDELIMTRETKKQVMDKNYERIIQIVRSKESNTTVRSRIMQFYSLHVSSLNDRDEMLYDAVQISNCLNTSSQITVNQRTYRNLIDNRSDDITNSNMDSVSTTSTKSDESRYVGADARYMLFTQPTDRVLQNIQIIQNQMEVTELLEEMVMILCMDIHAMEIYQSYFPKADVRLYTSKSIDRAVEIVDDKLEEVKELYRKSHNSIYRFIVIDSIDPDNSLRSSTFESALDCPILKKLVRYGELCNIGFVKNLTLPDVKYMQINLNSGKSNNSKYSDLMSGLNGVIFNPSYLTFSDIMKGRGISNNTICDAISAVNSTFYSIYRRMTDSTVCDITRFESKICDLNAKDSLLFTVPEGRVYVIGVEKDVENRFEKIFEELVNRDLKSSDTDSDSSDSDGFIKSNVITNQNIDKLVIIGSSDPQTLCNKTVSNSPRPGKAVRVNRRRF